VEPTLTPRRWRKVFIDYSSSRQFLPTTTSVKYLFIKHFSDSFSLAGFDVKPSNPGKCIEAIESFWERTIPEAEYPSDTESAQVLLQLYMMSAQAAQQQDGYNY
tara:strand:+ start:158 stop:469 length:312 start_codon:yes stop_codon:yes gene_type:complete